MFWFVFLIALFWGQWGGWGQLNCLFIDSTKTFKVPPFILHCLVCASITLYFYCIALCTYICRVRIALFMAPRTTGFHMCWQLNNCLWFLIIITIIITKQVTKLNTSSIIVILTFINTVSHHIDLCIVSYHLHQCLIRLIILITMDGCPLRASWLPPYGFYITLHPLPLLT